MKRLPVLRNNVQLNCLERWDRSFNLSCCLIVCLSDLIVLVMFYFMVIWLSLWCLLWRFVCMRVWLVCLINLMACLNQWLLACGLRLFANSGLLPQLVVLPNPTAPQTCRYWRGFHVVCSIARQASTIRLAKNVGNDADLGRFAAIDHRKTRYESAGGSDVGLLVEIQKRTRTQE